MEPTTIMPLSLAGGVGTAGCVFLTIGFLRTRMVRGWVPATGQVVTRHGATTGAAGVTPTFRWEDQDGHVHQRTSMVNSSSSGLSPGTVVRVLYDPAAPGRAIIDTATQRGTIFTTIGGLLLGLACVLGASGAALAVAG